MLFRLVASSLRRRGRSQALAFGVLAAATAAAAALAALVISAGDAFTRSLDGFGANLAVRPAAGVEAFPEADLAALDRIFWRNNLVAVAPVLAVRPRLQAPAGGAAVATLVGSRFDAGAAGRPEGLPGTRGALPVEGRWPADGAAETTVGRRLASRLGVAPGSRLVAELGGERRDLAVVGVVAGGGAEEEEAFAPLALVQGLAGTGPVVGGAEIYALTVPETPASRRDPATMTATEYDDWYCTAFPSAIALQVDEALPAAEATIVRQVVAAGSDVLLELRIVLLALAGGILLAAALAVAATLASSWEGRHGELALLYALGADRRWLAGLLLVESLALGLAGGLAGGICGLTGGAALARAVFGLPASPSLALLPFCAAAGVLVALFGALRSGRRALAAPPAVVLQGAAA